MLEILAIYKMWYNCDTLKPELRGRAPGQNENTDPVCSVLTPI